MSRAKILFFIIGVYALIVGASFALPEEGISIGSFNFGFASPSELRESVLPARSAPKGPSPEELLRQRMEDIRLAERDRFESWFTESPSRIHFPGGDPSLLDGFFASLDAARSEPVRILHYGDSQIEEDRISSTIRNALQERFGGGGPGLLPFGRPYYTLAFWESSDADLPRQMVYGEADRRSDGLYGPLGQVATLDTVVTTGIGPAKANTSGGRFFNRLTLLGSGKINLRCGRENHKLETSAPGELGFLSIELADSTSKVRFTVSGAGSVYGFSAHSGSGVILDNIPMRGCSGNVFTRINASQLHAYATQANVRLVLLQFGGNAMPYRKTPASIGEYRRDIEKQILRIREVMPDAAILFIGPSDMSTNVRGKMQTYPHLPMMVDSLKAAALESGAAFWDMYEAMGGENSMVEWVKARPQLAGSDYVHFTRLGAEAIGNMLLESILLYYDYYRWRMEGAAQ